MHCVHLADIAALVSQHGPAILYRRASVPPEAITRYWVVSRARLELWHHAMARYRSAETSGEYQQLRQWWEEHLILLEEILVSQLLTRVIASLASSLDANHSSQELTPITHAIYLSHLEATNRVHNLMLRGRGIGAQDVVKLNRLRQGVERWTDVLLGRLHLQPCGTIRYAIDPNRAKTYAAENRAYGHDKTRSMVSWLMNASMREMLLHRTSPQTALPHANRAVASSIVLLLRPDLFDSVGTLRSLWLHRMQIDSERTDRVLQELQAPDLDKATTIQGIEATHDSVFQRWYL